MTPEAPKKRTIFQIRQEMEKLTKSKDPEDAHGAADELLVEALEMLGGIRVRPLVETYRRVRKWFA